MAEPGFKSVCLPVKYVPLAELICHTHWHREAQRSSTANTKGLEFHLTSQANKLACYIFMDVGKRHKTPGLKTKER